MKDLLMYLVLAGIGYFTGSRLKKQTVLLCLAGRVQTTAVVILLVAMGMRMGANPEVTDNLGTIGGVSAVLTLAVMLFSGAAACAARKLIGMDKFAQVATGETGSEIDSEAGREEGKDGSRKLIAVLILISVTGGFLCGWFIVPQLFAGRMAEFEKAAGGAVSLGLYVLLYLIGFNMGTDGTVIAQFRKVGMRILIFPLFVMAGAFLAALLCAALMGFSPREALAVTAGFGWYSIAPGIILEAGYAACGAMSFMHCIMREYFSLLLVPFVAKKAGYMEAVGICGAAAMGVCLPIVEKSTRSDVAIYSFISGLVHTLTVPVLTPLLLS